MLSALHSFGSRPFVLTGEPTLIIAPHPDDETLGCGGLIALKRERGATVHVVVLTDGGDASVRRGEALDALAVLGVAASEVTFLGGVDGSLGSLTGAVRAGIVAQLASVVVAHGATEVFLPHRADVHSDHEAAYQFTQEALTQAGVAAAQWQYAIWLLWWKPFLFINLPPGHIAHARRLAIDTVWNKKQQAIAHHPSQLTESILPGAFLRRFSAPYELFFGPPG